MNLSNYQIGSDWNIWDLHIHTPFTKLSNNYKFDEGVDIWETYCDVLENSEVQVFGITDYFNAENYFILKEKYKQFYPDSTKLVLLNIEFRLEVSVNKKGEEVNLHVLFSDEVSKKAITNFLTQLETNITRNGATLPCNSLSDSEISSAAVSHRKLKEILRKVFGSNKPYIIIAAANNAGLRADTNSPRKLIISDEIDKICDCFFGGIQNVSYYLDKNRYENDELAISKPVLSGSDSHSFDDISNFLGKRFTVFQESKEIISKDITWIKANKTFEGLRQILHEPSSRIYIGENEPRRPIRKIDMIRFNFSNDIKIKRRNSETYQDLCIRELNNDINFSPFFTCIIGGRGTGKSTIINILAEKLGIKTDFFSNENNSLYTSEGVPYNLKEDILKLITVAGTQDIEFVSQGKVEKLTEGKELTRLIFDERILEPNVDLQNAKSELNKIITKVEDQINLLSKLPEIDSEISSTEKSKLVYKSVIDSINDPTYTRIVNEIKLVNDEISTITESREQYLQLLEKIERILSERPNTEISFNFYQSRSQNIYELLLSVPEINEDNGMVLSIPVESEDVQLEINNLNERLSNSLEELKLFFQQRGTSEESIRDSQNASISYTNLANKIIYLEEEKNSILNRISENIPTIDKLISLNVNSKNIIEDNIRDLNAKLERTNENVFSISYKVGFNSNLFTDSLFDDFKKAFSKYHISGTSWDSVKELLFSFDSKDVLESDYTTFLAKFNEIIDYNFRRTNNYVIIVANIFSSEYNYLIYKNLVIKHFYNIFKYIDIAGFYGETELRNSSFGQKCTAVIVTLLMSGVKPLIIDEPEAHLDNRLIADYLVELIKEKKADRQLIFATHNANFVINGDAEYIHILEIPENRKFTFLTSTTIENIENREKLLKLEGGKEAFIKREKKLLST